MGVGSFLLRKLKTIHSKEIYLPICLSLLKRLALFIAFKTDIQ